MRTSQFSLSLFLSAIVYAVLSNFRQLPPTTSSYIRGSSVVIDEQTKQCRFFLAESAIPRGGLGLFTAIDISEGSQAQAMPDVCIYVADTPRRTQFDTHSWARDVFLGTYEGRNPRAACEGFATLFNTMPPNVATSKLVLNQLQSNAGLSRYQEPGAGAITHYYGIDSVAIRDVAAGAELTIDYGDWKYNPNKKYKAPKRAVEWIQTHGMCIDHIRIGQATDPSMGRGAFASRALRKGTLVAPAPLQTYKDRADFGARQPEALFVNYCFQPKNMTLLLFPYGPGVNMINHHSERPNVALRWSTSHMNHQHWLNLPYEEVEEMNYPGGLILDIVAIHDIAEGEEIFLDYGQEWEEAWNRHVENWIPYDGDYVYATEGNSESKIFSAPFRTVEEQRLQPNPSNMATACWTPNWERDESGVMEWHEPTYEWPEGVASCHILDRKTDSKEGYLYRVAVDFDWRLRDLPSWLSEKQMNIDINVPHRAIIAVDKPYTSDLHLKNAFRHPIGFPDHLIPDKWSSS
jgi:hypothetical protein